MRRNDWLPSDAWKWPIQKCVLWISDQQLVTGIAILGAGFSQIPAGVPVYHWQIAVYVAWFSSITHLACLTALREYSSKNHVIYVWRITLMVILAVLQIAALVPVGHPDWNSV